MIINRSNTNQEDLKFGKEGYYYVKDGETLRRRYKIQKMLGSGVYASVHKADDRRTGATVAVKITRCGKRFNDSSDWEIEYMNKMKAEMEADSSNSGPGTSARDSLIGSKNVVKLLDDFKITGQFGKHVVLVFEMVGPDLYSVLNRSNQQILRVHRIRTFAQDILDGLDFLHTKCKVMHLDLKPENLLVKLDPNNSHLNDPDCRAYLKIGDYGTSAYSSDVVTRLVQTCHYRAPESFLNCKITPYADIWSYGCILYEMTTHNLLFPCNHGKPCHTKHHCRLTSELLGAFKASSFERNEKNGEKLAEIFEGQARYKMDRGSTNWIHHEELRKDNPTLEELDARWLSEYLRTLLVICPKERMSAREAMEDRFMKETGAE